MKSILILITTTTLSLANPVEELIKDINEAEVTIFFESVKKEHSFYDNMFISSVQGQKLSLESKGYLKFSLNTQRPMKLSDRAIQDLEKIDFEGDALIGSIQIESATKQSIYVINKNSHLSIIHITKLVHTDRPDKIQTIDLGKYYWPQVELVVVEIAAREHMIVFGKELHDKARADAWKILK